jgi:transketolase
VRRQADLHDPGSFDHVGRDRGAHFVAGDVLAELAEDDRRIVAGTADLKYVTQMAGFAERHPERFFEFGIAERNMLSAAAGMATTGLIPYMSTFACFSGILAYEVIRTDLAYPNLPVRVLATHAGIAMGFFGTSHHATEDIAALRSVAGLMILSQSDRHSTEALLRATVEHDGPIYFRIGRGQEHDLYDGMPEGYRPGRPHVLRRGTDLLLLATGMMVREAALAAQRLEDERDLSVGVADVHTLKPFPVDEVVELASAAGAVLTVEEHNIEGGLGSLVADALVSAGIARPFAKHGIHDEFAAVGPPTHLYRYYGLDADGIATVAWRLLERGRASGSLRRAGGSALWGRQDRDAVLHAVRG